MSRGYLTYKCVTTNPHVKTNSMLFRPLIYLDRPPKKSGCQGKSKGLKTIDLVLTWGLVVWAQLAAQRGAEIKKLQEAAVADKARFDAAAKVRNGASHFWVAVVHFNL